MRAQYDFSSFPTICGAFRDLFEHFWIFLSISFLFIFGTILRGNWKNRIFSGVKLIYFQPSKTAPRLRENPFAELYNGKEFPRDLTSSDFEPVVWFKSSFPGCVCDPISPCAVLTLQVHEAGVVSRFETTA